MGGRPAGQNREATFGSLRSLCSLTGASSESWLHPAVTDPPQLTFLIMGEEAMNEVCKGLGAVPGAGGGLRELRVGVVGGGRV